jgi:parallel beta-helix repeat protein
MMPIRFAFFAIALSGQWAAMPVRAAESYDSCAGHFIDSLPATITAQGTWCLRKDLATNVISGNAIEIAANNVTIDCNGFKLGGLAAGENSMAVGIHAVARQNISVKHCNVRGFYTGILLKGSGNLVEDNRADNNLYIGIVAGDSSETGGMNAVRRNAVFSTGGSPYNAGNPVGIWVTGGEVADNVVDGAFSVQSSVQPVGILLDGLGASARGNHVRGLLPAGNGTATGIFLVGDGHHATVRGNTLVADATNGAGTGIDGYGDSDTFCSGNTVAGFATAMTGCQDAGGNNSH